MKKANLTFLSSRVASQNKDGLKLAKNKKPPAKIALSWSQYKEALSLWIFQYISIRTYIHMYYEVLGKNVSIHSHGTAFRAWHRVSIMIILSPKLIPALLS